MILIRPILPSVALGARRSPSLTMDMDFAYPSPLCAPADRLRMGSSAVWLPSPPPPSIMALGSPSRRCTIDSVFRISISGVVLLIRSPDTGSPPRRRSPAFPSAMPSFAAALALCHSIETLMVSSLRLAPYFTWMVLVRSFPAFLMATCLTVSLSTPGPVSDVFGRRIVPSSTPPLQPAASRSLLPRSPLCLVYSVHSSHTLFGLTKAGLSRASTSVNSSPHARSFKALLVRIRHSRIPMLSDSSASFLAPLEFSSPPPICRLRFIRLHCRPLHGYRIASHDRRAIGSRPFTSSVVCYHPSRTCTPLVACALLSSLCLVVRATATLRTRWNGPLPRTF